MSQLHRPPDFALPSSTASWYLLLSKPKQEWRACEQLTQQGYTIFMPTLRQQKPQQGELVCVQEPLFPRYLFIRLSQSLSNWMPIHSTRGVSRMVRFGNRYAKVSESLIESLQEAEEEQRNWLQAGDIVRVTEGPFRGLEGIYQQQDGTQRVLLLMELLSRPQLLSIPVTSLKRISVPPPASDSAGSCGRGAKKNALTELYH